jgi:iron complex outermembrane receptor protein
MKIKTMRHSPGKIKTLALLTAAALGTGSAFASVLEEVTVTAQKREQNMQDVGVSVTAYSGDQMKALGITNTVEITEQMPALQMSTFSPHLTIFNIRGVSQNNFTDNLEAPVAVYIDEAYMGTMNGINAQLFDVERVEVLRGPQGTLFGRNATGGVIHYLTKGADDDELNGYVEATYADYDKKSFEGAVGGGISENLRFRLAGRWEQSDGYIESKPYPFAPGADLPPPSGQDLGGTDGWAARLALAWDINDDATLELSYKYSKDDEVPTGGYSFLPYGDNANAYIPPEFEDFVVNVIGAPAAATPDIFFCESQLECFAPVDQAGRTIFEGDHPNPHEHYSNYKGFMDRDTNALTAKLNWDLGEGLQLTSITHWMDLDKFYTEDGDGIPAPVIEFTTLAEFEQFSQEIRLSKESDRIRWQAGLYFLDMETSAGAITRGAPAAGEAQANGVSVADSETAGVVQDYVLESENWSVFGQFEYDLTDALTLILGARYSQDDKNLRFKTRLDVPANPAQNIDPLFDLNAAVAAGGGDQDTIDYSDYAARVQLDYRMNDDTLVFASWNRGIKGGNFAPSSNVRINDIKHDEEVLNAFEIGFKTQFADGLARLNATAFYYDYDDYQAFTFANGTPSVANADAENQGAEIELVLLPTENWDIILGASFQDSSVDGVQTPQQQFTPVGFEVDWPIDVLNGVEMPNAPSLSLNYLVRYNMDIGNNNLAFQVDGVYYGDQYLEVTNGGAALQEAYNVYNVSATWTAMDEALAVKLWMKNAGDEVYKVYALDLGILGGTVTYAPPRWWGATVSYKF